jgi:anti-sigma B factor antagonist
VVQEQESPGLSVRDEWDGDEATVTVHGEIDMTTVAMLRTCLGSVIGRNPKRLTIDLAGADFLDTSALHELVKTRRALPSHCPLVLRAPQPQARRILQLTRLDTLFTIE